MKHLNQLAPADQSRAAALILRCADQAALGEHAEALELAGRLAGDPGIEEADFLVVLPVISSSDEPVAFRILESLDARHRSSEKTWPQLAAAYQRRGDWKRARETLEKVAQNSPGKVQPLMDLAQVSWRQKDFEGTLGYLAHARDLDPKNATVHFLIAIVCNELRVPLEAKRSIEGPRAGSGKRLLQLCDGLDAAAVVGQGERHSLPGEIRRHEAGRCPRAPGFGDRVRRSGTGV